jgi:cholesterol transport system auxiliary component
VLQWFEEHRIPVDFIAGTSMGGLIGGSYASGMTPAELLRQRLADTLGQRRALLSPEGAASTGTATLRLSLEEFSQLFDSPQQSRALLRLRATLSQTGPAGDRVLAQRSIIVQRPAPSADAPGGVRALSAATDAAAEELLDWLAQNGH